MSTAEMLNKAFKPKNFMGLCCYFSVQFIKLFSNSVKLLFIFSIFYHAVNITGIKNSSADNDIIQGEYLLKYHDELTTTQKHILTNELGLNLLNEYQQAGDILLASEIRRRRLDHGTIKELLASGIIEYFEPNYRVQRLTTPNDSRFNEQWGLDNKGENGGRSGIDIDAKAAWGLTTGINNIVIGVVDSGVAVNHPDLRDNMWVNSGEVPSGSDSDGNGIVDDIYGYNAISKNGNPNDDNGHGTHCAGIIAARGNNGLGISGVSWNSKIMALKFLDSRGSGSIANAIEAIEYAIRQKQKGVNLRILNNSWGGSSYSQALENAIRAAGNHNILFVVAAGNNGANNDSTASYPANFNLDNVISVAAIDRNGNLANFSNYGTSRVHLAAPGVGILSTYLNNTYSNLSGTSMAAPFVSGIAALILSREPNLSASQLKSRLIYSARPLANLNNLVSSGGIASASRALSNTQTPPPPSPNLPSYSQRSVSFRFDNTLGTRVSTGDDEYIPVNLNFNFPFYERSFNRIAISTNGRIIPLSTNEGLPTYPDYASSIYPGISVLNHDFLAGASPNGGVWVKNEADKSTISWIVRPYLYSRNSDPNLEIHFQSVLSSSGLVEIRYLKTNVGNPDLDSGARSTVSIMPLDNQEGERLIVSNNSSNPALLGNEKAILISPESRQVFSDFDGDGLSDLIVWRPSTGNWFILLSSTDYSYQDHVQIQHGLPGDNPLIGDFDGDKRVDLAVWRPQNGTWYIRSSKSNYQVLSAVQWGLSQDTPLVGDFDGDGVTDISVYRASSGVFYSLLSTTGFNREGALSGNSASIHQISLGGPGNDPVVADFSGNGVDDYGTVWQLKRFWTVKDAANGLLFSLPWGEPGDTPLACDRDIDGKADRFMIRVNSDNRLDWFGYHSSGTVEVKHFGSLGDKPGCRHHVKSENKPQLIIFRPQSGEWFISENNDTSIRKIQFGLPDDIAIM
ncbi:MAG TPA: S8 family serine peptidase [Oligoflexia bacterium]|nr:S8 family serine peptidase [Oligoflexia bacterium]HMP49840.1 S8 family serine peptidase [Oligoflexia bacterium]